jgi:hypothetical protein
MNRQSAKLPTLSYLDFRKKVIEGLVGNVRNKRSRKRGRPGSTDVEDLNGKLHLIQAHDGEIKMDCAVCANREVEEDRRKRTFYYEEARSLSQQMFCHISYSEEVPFGV